MALTKKEMEVKIAALEDRISFVSETAESLEWRFEHGVERWTAWASDLQTALRAISRQIDTIRQKVPMPQRR